MFCTTDIFLLPWYLVIKPSSLTPAPPHCPIPLGLFNGQLLRILSSSAWLEWCCGWCQLPGIGQLCQSCYSSNCQCLHQPLTNLSFSNFWGPAWCIRDRYQSHWPGDTVFNCDARVIVVTGPGGCAGTTASVSAFDCASLELTLLSVVSVVFVSRSGKAE